MKATPCLFQQAFNYTTELPPLNLTVRYKSYDQITLKSIPWNLNQYWAVEENIDTHDGGKNSLETARQTHYSLPIT